MKFTLDNINETQFEDFCYDLLSSLDFVNLSWRKGTGLSSSPSDQGRDLEGELLRKEFDGIEYHEKYFIECKHYKKGVPPEKIQGALSWASSNRPDVLLIIVSNFLSNPTKNYLKEYEKNNKPTFRIKVWELKDLENLSAGNNDLRHKYNLATEISFLPIINKYHLLYICKPHRNSISYFIELMDSLDSEKRDKALEYLYWDFIRPRFRQPISGKEKLGELKIDPTTYDAFRQKCLDVKKEKSYTFVHKMVSLGLAWLFHFADTTSVEEIQKEQQSMIDTMEELIIQEVDEEEKKGYNKIIQFSQKHLSELPKKTAEFYELYQYVCEELVRKLLSENNAYENY